MTIPSLSELMARRENIKARIGELGDLRPGSLKDRFRKCGKPNCRCAEPGHVGHGPSWSLTHSEKGKTVTKIIPVAAVPQTRQQLAECQRLRGLTQELVAVSEKICDARIVAGREGNDEKSEEGAKKNFPDRAAGRRHRR